MHQSATSCAARRPLLFQEKTFSLEQARRALQYLRPVLADAVQAYREAQAARSNLCADASKASRAAICEQRDAALARLNRTIDECHAVGVCMVNIAQGALAMNVRDGESHICVIWRLGESIDSAWEQIDEPLHVGPELVYAARQGCA